MNNIENEIFCNFRKWAFEICCSIPKVVLKKVFPVDFDFLTNYENEVLKNFPVDKRVKTTLTTTKHYLTVFPCSNHLFNWINYRTSPHASPNSLHTAHIQNFFFFTHTKFASDIPIKRHFFLSSIRKCSFCIFFVVLLEHIQYSIKYSEKKNIWIHLHSQIHTSTYFFCIFLCIYFVLYFFFIIKHWLFVYTFARVLITDSKTVAKACYDESHTNHASVVYIFTHWKKKWLFSLIFTDNWSIDEKIFLIRLNGIWLIVPGRLKNKQGVNYINNRPVDGQKNVYEENILRHAMWLK